MNAYGYGAHKEDLGKRLRRIEGQIRGINRMIDNDTYCINILTQISAAQAALDKVALGLVRDHAAHCLTDDDKASRADKADELVSAVARLIKA